MKGIWAALLVLVSTAAYGDIYTWKDSRGTAFYTNSLHEIPARYLKKARVLDVATGKKGGLVTAQPNAPLAGSPPGPAAGSAAQSPAPIPVATPAPPRPASAASAVVAPPPAAVGAPIPQQPLPTRTPRRAPRRPHGPEDE
jgi:hypothetical protein